MVIKTKINGSYLEDIVPGYKTLFVRGREPLDLEPLNISLPARDGDIFRSRRVNARELQILFSLEAATPAAYTAAYNQLKGELYKAKNSQLIFDDEPGCYFVGTCDKIDVDYVAGQPAHGAIVISCADPFKYAVSETVISADNGTITAEYGGTYPAHPILTAQSMTHDCGFYSFEDEAGHLIQIGNPEEEDQEEAPTDHVVESIDANFGTNYWPSYDPYDQAVWHRDWSRLLYGYVTNDLGFESARDYIYALPAYPGGEPSAMFGPTLGTNITASPNFLCSFLHWFEPLGNQGGGFDLYLNNRGGGNVCGVCIRRAKGNPIYAYMIVKGKVVKTLGYSFNTNPFKSEWHTQTISKSLGTVSFNVGGVAFSTTDPDLVDHSYDVANISFIIYKQPGADQIGANNSLKNIQFRGYSSEWVEFDNVVPRGGLVEVDTGSGEISVNDDPQPNLGSIYNDFEDFKLSTGENTIICSSSGWVDDASYIMKYREVYL